MKISTLILLFGMIFITGCDQGKNSETATPEFKPPIGPHGLPYRVGNLGGKPVLLGEEVKWLEYEDSPVLRRENRYKGYEAPPRNLDSVVTAFGVYMKYTTGLVLVRYGGAPEGSEAAKTVKESSQQYDAERDLLNNEWIDIGIHSGIRYHPDLTGAFISSTLDTKIQSQESLQNTHYRHIYIPTHKQEFGLDQYDPHPEWINRSGYQKTKEMYIEKDSKGKVRTLIRCTNFSVDDRARRCDMRWNMEPFMQAQLSVSFARAHLTDWRIIQERSEKVIKSFVVDPNKNQTNK